MVVNRAERSIWRERKRKMEIGPAACGAKFLVVTPKV
jgi:hypothetical protein